MEINYDTPLGEAQEWLRDKLTEGANCPCCGQLSKVYRRKLYGSMAASLLHFYKNFDTQTYTHKRDILALADKTFPTLSTTLGGGDFAKLMFWGLLEQKPAEENNRGSGYWRVTEKGSDFVNGKVKIPSHVMIYNGDFLGLDGDDVSIQDCLGEKFSYTELMGGGPLKA